MMMQHHHMDLKVHCNANMRMMNSEGFEYNLTLSHLTIVQSENPFTIALLTIGQVTGNPPSPKTLHALVF